MAREKSWIKEEVEAAQHEVSRWPKRMTRNARPFGHYSDRELEIYRRAIETAADVARSQDNEMIADLIEEKADDAELEVIRSRERQKQNQQKRWASDGLA